MFQVYFSRSDEQGQNELIAQVDNVCELSKQLQDYAADLSSCGWSYDIAADSWRRWGDGDYPVFGRILVQEGVS